jgi:septum formation inhibitor-activating ATPase MinD
MNHLEFFKIFKDIKHRILDEEHELKELLEDQKSLFSTLQALASKTKPLRPTFVRI